MVKPISDKRYRYSMVRLSIRWCDYERLRAAFPAQYKESAASYFQRLAKKMQEVSK